MDTMESSSTKRRVGKWTLLFLCLTLAGVAIYQFVELRRLHTEIQGRIASERAKRYGFEDEMRAAWGCYLETLGGVNQPPLEYYEFEGGIHVTAGRNRCSFQFPDTVDSNVRKQLMKMIAPKIARGSEFILPSIEEEWKSLSESRYGVREYYEYDGQSEHPKLVSLRHQSSHHSISIEWVAREKDAIPTENE